jgi:hypothetical protein
MKFRHSYSAGTSSPLQAGEQRCNEDTIPCLSLACYKWVSSDAQAMAYILRRCLDIRQADDHDCSGSKNQMPPVDRFLMRSGRRHLVTARCLCKDIEHKCFQAKRPDGGQEDASQPDVP